MKKASIVAYGHTDFTREDVPVQEKLVESIKDLIDSNENVSKNEIDAVLVSTNDNTKYLSAIIAESIGIQPKISHTVESLCNSGTNTLISGISYILSGMAKRVLVVGGDRYDGPGQILEWDKARGDFKHPIFWASIFSKSYKKEFSITGEDLAIVAAKNHKNAQDNPHAYSKKPYSVQEILDSKQITDELHILDCSRPCTGSSAVLITEESVSKQHTEQPVSIKGIGQKTISAGFTKNPVFSSMKSVEESAKMAYEDAKVTPNDIDVAEVHDAFSVCEPMAIESLGLAEKGRGVVFAKELYDTENKMINPRGGLIGAGHPLGATGISQTIEIVQQLQGNSKKRQVSNAEIGLVQNMSAAATSSTVLVLEA